MSWIGQTCALAMNKGIVRETWHSLFWEIGSGGWQLASVLDRNTPDPTAVSFVKN